MPRFIAFLRGINLGKRRVKMQVLVDRMTALGFTKVSTHLASGNVLFSHPKASPAELEARVESGLGSALGYPVETHVRSEAEVRALADRAPAAAGSEALASGVLYVAFFKGVLTPGQQAALAACSTETDAFTPTRSETYWRSALPFHESKIWASPRVRQLALPAMTFRGHATVQGIAALGLRRNARGIP